MMKITKVLLIAAVVLMGVFSSCKKDDFSKNDQTPKYTETAITNQAVVAKLKAQGFTFNEAGALLLDGKALDAKSLDLSGTKVAVKDLAFVAMFPSVTELNLANNGYDMKFDFSELPSNVKSVDLSGNKIYEFDGLMKLNEKTKESIILREMTSIILPHSAMYNVETLPFYFKKMGDKLTMTMYNNDGKAEPYTTLREVPDADVRALLKKNFPTKFDGDKLDILKRFGESRNTDLDVSTFTFWGEIPLKNKQIQSIEGVEYIVADPEWRGAFTANLLNITEGLSLPYLKVNENCSKINTVRVHTSILNLSSAKNLISCIIANDKAITAVDFTNTKIGKIGLAGGDIFSGCQIMFNSCPQLEKITLPNLKEVKEPVLSTFSLIALPKLKTCNVSQFEWIRQMDLAGLPALTSLEYPNIKFAMNDNGEKLELGGKESINFYFSIDKSIYEMPKTKQFIEKMQKIATLSTKENASMMGPLGIVDYNGKNSIEFYNYKK